MDVVRLSVKIKLLNIPFISYMKSYYKKLEICFMSSRRVRERSWTAVCFDKSLAAASAAPFQWHSLKGNTRFERIVEVLVE